jgi:hypothetical protein
MNRGDAVARPENAVLYSSGSVEAGIPYLASPLCSSVLDWRFTAGADHPSPTNSNQGLGFSGAKPQGF